MFQHLMFGGSPIPRIRSRNGGLDGRFNVLDFPSEPKVAVGQINSLSGVERCFKVDNCGDEIPNSNDTFLAGMLERWWSGKSSNSRGRCPSNFVSAIGRFETRHALILAALICLTPVIAWTALGHSYTLIRSVMAGSPMAAKGMKQGPSRKKPRGKGKPFGKGADNPRYRLAERRAAWLAEEVALWLWAEFYLLNHDRSFRKKGYHHWRFGRKGWKLISYIISHSVVRKMVNNSHPHIYANYKVTRFLDWPITNNRQ